MYFVEVALRCRSIGILGINGYLENTYRYWIRIKANWEVTDIQGSEQARKLRDKMCCSNIYSWMLAYYLDNSPISYECLILLIASVSDGC